VECSNRGSCDTMLGTCACYATPGTGFSGTACASAAVPVVAQFSALDPILDVIGNEDVVSAVAHMQTWLSWLVKYVR
jgi:hypothetical protein